jgi:phosphate transport system permease protein
MSGEALTGKAVLPPRKAATEASSTWSRMDRLGLAVCWLLGVLFCAIAAAIVIFMMVQGIKYLRPSLLVTSPTAGFSESQTGGFLDPLIGTVVVALLGLAIALPLGVTIAVWLTEYGRPFSLARATESTIEMLAGVPDIVLALFGLLIFSSPILGFLSRSSGHVVFGRSFLAAGAMLSLVALPLIVGSTREGQQAIPAHLREASLAVGKTRFATIRRVLLPTARPSVITGSMLGLGRIIGDTAIIVVLLGATLTTNPAGGTPVLGVLKGTGSTLTSFIYANSPTGEANQPTKAYAAAFVLLLVVLALNLCVDLVGRRRKAVTWSS